MKKIITLIVLLSAPLISHANPALMLGINISFDGNLGVTAKVLSNDKEDKAVAAFGVGYYPSATNKFGIDLGLGYTKSNIAGTVGWDFLQNSLVGSLGYANTQKKKSAATTTTGGTTGDAK